MVLEVRKVSKEDYEAYWMPDVCKLLEPHIHEKNGGLMNLGET